MDSRKSLRDESRTIKSDGEGYIGKCVAENPWINTNMCHVPYKYAYSTSPGFLFLSSEDTGLALQAKILTTAPGW